MILGSVAAVGIARPVATKDLTFDSLALRLARTLGKTDPRNIRIEVKISHEALSEMVGTTRPRITVFMHRFRNLGLIETKREHFLVIKENKLTDYLAQIA